MKTILLDENLPQPLRLHLKGSEVATVGYKGWSGIQNDDLIALINDKFDILLTGDQSLRYQQNLTQRTIAIIEVPDTRLNSLLPLVPQIQQAIVEASPGSYTQIKSAS